MGSYQLNKHFNISDEETIYRQWESAGHFQPREGGKPFFIPMPPPNITGQLHMGHALFATLQDILIRHRRMTGWDAIWIPGTDHAGIATQEKITQHLTEQGIPLERETFLAHAWEWKDHYRNRITGQLRRLGASCDWSRERFTLDESHTRATITAFMKCHEAGMLYRQDGQWWLDMKPLADDLLARYRAGELKIEPESEGKTLCHFLEGIQPWCISRQIWWGHRIPIWWNKNGQWTAATSQEDAEDKLGPCWQDEDCLDTWFSSALWPFALLGWPDDTPDLKRWYPASLIETADDILFFWCARMLMMGLLLTDKMAFSTIYLHGIIRDENGLKQSKSLGNGIDPLTIIDQYGCDSLRWALAENNSAGQDQRLSDEKFDSAKRFGNKIWQASRFMLMNWNRIGNPTITEPTPIHADDCQLYGELMACRSEMNEALLEMDFRKAAHAFRHFFHGRFCDWWIEAAKPRMRDGDELCCLMGMWALKECLKMLHPFMPYRSERIWQAIESTPLILQQW